MNVLIEGIDLPKEGEPNVVAFIRSDGTVKYYKDANDQKTGTARNGYDTLRTGANTMTIREIIQQKVSKQSGQIEPIDFAWFQINMAGIIVSICYDLASSDVGQIYLGKQNVGRGKADIPAIADIIPIINGDDMLRNMILTRQVIGFFNWFLDQDEPGEGEEDQDGAPLDWCDMSFILRKWNEYANTENGKRQQGA